MGENEHEEARFDTLSEEPRRAYDYSRYSRDCVKKSNSTVSVGNPSTRKSKDTSPTAQQIAHSDQLSARPS